MNIGDIIESEGMKRKITGFSVINGEQFPDTEPYMEIEDDDNEPATDELKCQYCGKVYKDASWLEAHEEKCKENPKNKGGEE